MKKMIVAMLVGVSMISVSRADWTAPIQTTYTNVVTETIQVVQTNEVVVVPSFVKLDTVTIRSLSNDKTVVTVGWSWMDSNTNVVRRGYKNFSQEQISVKLTSMGSSFEAMQGLFMALAAEDAVAPE